MVLQEGVSVLPLVQSRHSPLKLLQPRAQVVLSPPPPGQVGIHHPAQREVVAYICTLTETGTFQTFRLEWSVFFKHDILGDTTGLISHYIPVFFVFF